jgi:ABC-type Fe2+-enterobactin transport system substrate-binding protein
MPRLVPKQRHQRAEVGGREQARQQPALPLVLLALGEHQAVADHVGDQPLEEGRLLERVAFLVQDLPEGGQARHEHRVRVAHVEIPD